MREVIISFLFIFVLAFNVSAQADEARTIDEFGNTNCEDYLARIDNAIAKAQNNPSSTVYILIYEGKELKYNSRTKKDEWVFPTVGLAKAKIASIKKYLSLRKLPEQTFSYVEAGLNEYFMVEIWLVPNGAILPKPTPTLNKIKRRKGKAIGFCLGCC